MGLVTWGGPASTELARSARPRTGGSDGLHWLWLVALVIAAIATMAEPGRAQVGWDTPRMIGPESPGGLSALWLRSSAPGVEGDGAIGIWSLPGSGRRVLVRGGAVLDEDDRVSAFGGIDVRTPLARHTESQPLDIEWYAGVGAGGGVQEEQYVLVTLPMGVSVGRSWSSGAVWLAPYLSMGVALDLALGDEAPDEPYAVTPAADVGLDFALDSARRFVFRVGASLGDRQAVAVGLAVGGGR